MTDLADDELLTAWQAGDRRAGAALFDRHFRTIARFVRSKVWSEDEVDDLVQSTFVACLAAPARFRGEGSLRGYLLGIAYHKLQKLYGERARRPIDVEQISVHDLGPGPSTALAQRAEHRLLLAALRRLPLQFQVVLELSYWEEMTAGAIGAVLGEPEGTIRTRLRRAKELLTVQLRRLGAAPALLESTLGDLDGWAASLRAAV